MHAGKGPRLLLCCSLHHIDRSKDLYAGEIDVCSVGLELMMVFARLQIEYTLCWSIVLEVIWQHTSSGMAGFLKQPPGTLCAS
jgi:hypothetical protein